MRALRFWGVLVIAVLAASSCAALSRASTTSSGAELTAGSFSADVSATGRYVVFETSESLDGSDTNGVSDVFRKDLETDAVVRVSAPDGSTGGANGPSSAPAVSDDGDRVAFVSAATDLVGGDTNAADDVFVRELSTDTTWRVSVATGGAQATGASGAATISGDGLVAAFDSVAADLVAGDANTSRDVFTHDLATGTTLRVSVSAAAVEADAESRAPSLNTSGDTVAFESDATNLVASDTNATTDVFVRSPGGAVTKASTPAGGGHATGGPSADPSLAGDGSAVAFESGATNLVGGDTNATTDVFVADLATGTVDRASVPDGGGQGTGASQNPSTSDNGRVVAFDSAATNITGLGGGTGVAARDLDASHTVLVSSDAPGASPGTGSEPAVSADGYYTAFETTSSALISSDTNGESDIYSRFTFRPSITSVEPLTVLRGATTPVTMTGVGLGAVSGVLQTILNPNIPPDGVTFTNVNLENSTTITADVVTTGAAPVGAREIWATLNGNTSLKGGVAWCVDCFQVVDTPCTGYDTQWTNAAGGLFTDAGNWSSGVPDPTTSGCIYMDPADPVITYDQPGNSNAFAMEDLVNYETMQASGNRYIQGTFTNHGTVLSDSGSWLAFEDGTATNHGLVETDDDLFNQGSNTFNNYGTVRFTGSSSSGVFGNGSTFVNHASGVLEDAGSGAFTFDEDQILLSLAGEFRSTSTGTFSIESNVTESSSSVGTTEFFAGSGSEIIIDTWSTRDSSHMPWQGVLSATGPGSHVLGDINVTGVLLGDWGHRGGEYISGEIVIPNGSSITNDGTSWISFYDSNVANAGTVTFGHDLYIQTDTVFLNTGTMHYNGSASRQILDSGTAPHRLINDGTIEDAGSGELDIDESLELVSRDATYRSTAAGRLRVAAEFGVGEGLNTFEATSGAEVHVDTGSQENSNQLDWNGTLAAVGSGSSRLGDVQFVDATLTGDWLRTQASFEALSGSATIPSGASIRQDSETFMSVHDLTLTNHGTVEFKSDLRFAGAGDSIIIGAGALVEYTGDGADGQGSCHNIYTTSTQMATISGAGTLANNGLGTLVVDDWPAPPDVVITAPTSGLFVGEQAGCPY